MIRWMYGFVLREREECRAQRSVGLEPPEWLSRKAVEMVWTCSQLDSSLFKTVAERLT